MDRLLLVCLGGALGSGARYLASEWAKGDGPHPVGTWLVNIGGSFLLGFLSAALADSDLSPAWKLGLTTGLMGGFTTYSTFSLETAALIERGSFAHAGMNVGVTLAACLLATFLGLWLGRTLFAPAA